ncbi:MAG: tRNA 2-thiouridine(34) synthase MnmA [Pirellulales bacterium]
MSRVVLAMSGGVDSSVAAALLRREGHDVIGLFMRHGGEPVTSCASGAASAAPQLPILGQASHKQGCCSFSDAHDARRVADKLDIPFYSIDFQAEFGRIMDYFVEEYTAGRTPNPCVMCNNWLKFGQLLQYADSVGADFVATGHYAQLTPAGPGQPPALRRGLDDGKDQSYVLFGIQRGVLPRVLFPVGSYHKHDIREQARQLGLRVADKKDSQEICFVPDNDHGAFVRRRRGTEIDLSGEIVTTSGEVVGQHGGLENYTIGQRKGLGVALGSPKFVVRLETDTRRVVIGEREDLAQRRITACRSNWLIEPPDSPLRCEVKVRYRSPPVPATVTPLDDGRLLAELDDPQFGVAPGQALVCYQADRVLGGGWIE